MRCPRCTQDGFNPYGVCAKCEFVGTPGHVEELGHIAYLLGELETWTEVRTLDRKSLRKRYLGRRESIEIDLGLRAPPMSVQERRKLQWELYRLRKFREEVGLWLERGWLRTDRAARLQQGIGKRIEALQHRLETAGAPPAGSFEGVRDRLRLYVYLEEMESSVHSHGYFVDDGAHIAALGRIQTARRDLEIEAGLQPRPAPVPAPVAVVAAPAPAAKAPSRPAQPPREPITWDRIWQTLLSERTLNILLFLGAFLLVASATTYLVYNWEALPPAAQLAAIVLFTLCFYAAGWFLRVRMKLRLSGIAVTAVGSLLVPLDFYAVFIAGGALPADAWPWVWLAASAVCLPIYTFTAIRIRASFFGYLVAVAAGSLVCASLQVMGAPAEWFLAALASLALALAALAYRVQRVENSWSILSNPLRFSALIAPAVLLPLGLGWWVVDGAGGLHFDASLAVAWTLGALLYAYAAVREGRPWLGRAAATTLPVAIFFLLRLAFAPLEIEGAWFALGWAGLAPLYLWLGRRFYDRACAWQPGRSLGASSGPATGDPVLLAHSQTATGWGLALMGIAALWSAQDLWAAAVTHAILVAGAILAIRLWQRPRALPVASLLAFSSITFTMAAAHLEPAELCLGWALLSLLHVLAALRLQALPGLAGPGEARGDYTGRLYGMALVFAALALLPPLILGHELLLTYALGQWIVLVAWLIWLDHGGKQPGLAALLGLFGPLRRSILHWAAALPLPFFAAMLYTRFRAPDAWLSLLLAGLSWLFFGLALSRRLTTSSFALLPASLLLRAWALPWYVAAYGCSLVAPLVASIHGDQALVAVTLFLASALYWASAWTARTRWWHVPAGLALPLGLLVLLDLWAVPLSQQSVVLALVVAAYLLGGVWLESRRSVSGEFMAPLYWMAHLVAFAALVCGFVSAGEGLFAGEPWTDAACLWVAGGYLMLGLAYGFFAWFHKRERWAHVAAWLGVMAGGLIATVYSTGRGSSAFKAALLAALYVLAERALASEWLRRRWPPAGQAWSLYRRPLLISGWAVSAGAIGLALLRNLVWLGGGREQAVWAIVGLLAVTTLYALSAWLFRRCIFVWLAGVLGLLPWTLLTVWGWFLWQLPQLPHFALSWAILACLQLGLGLALSHRSAAAQAQDYGFPLRAIANVLLPLSLLWGVADTATSIFAWGLGLVFYTVSAVADHGRGLAGWRATRFLYLAVVTLPVWVVYLLNYFAPAASYEWYGLALLALALPLLAVGRRLRHVDPADALPLYLGAYGVAIVGTVLVIPHRPFLAMALTFDALLCLLSAWLFRERLWVYPTTALFPAAMLVALAQSQILIERRGWWLIGLGAVYLALAWGLRRKTALRAYAQPFLVAASAVVALGLLPSSLDETGAFWGYLAAALIYAAAAAWLRWPFLLFASAGLSAVPYGVALVWLDISPANYGLALFPGVAAALALAHLLDRRLGKPGAIFASWELQSWRLGALLDWWAAPCYAWGYVGALVAVGLSLALTPRQAWMDSIRLALVLALAAVTYLHATWRFRSRAYLLLAGLLAQWTALTLIDAGGWLAHPTWTALAFLPVTLVTAALALAIELRAGEGSPLGTHWWRGWSRPLYLLLALDLLAGQTAALFHSEPGAIVTIANALLLALLATVWIQPLLVYAAAGLGAVGFFQVMAWAGMDSAVYPVGLALLALGYGLVGYGLAYLRWGRRRATIWRQPLEWAGLGLSAVALLWTGVVAGIDVAALTLRTALGLTATAADYALQVRTVMWVLALSGLLYLATAVVRRRYILGYAAVALLLGAWGLWWRFLLDMAGFQWYAVPAGLYLLLVGWFEWQQGHRALARWIDVAGMLIWLGSAWWQSLPGVMPSGWIYALIMGAESLFLVWWGSARRQKRFLYVGAAGVVLNVVTQSIEPLLSANRWIVFGIAGALLVGLAILVERKLESFRELSGDLRERLATWE